MKLLTGRKLSISEAENKKLTTDSHGLSPQFMKVMKLTFVLLTAAFLQLSAKGIAQNVTISVNNASLDKVFHEIERQTGYGFLYNKKMLKNTPLITLDVRNQPLSTVLQRCFNGRSISYDIQDSIIVITQNLKRNEVISTVIELQKNQISLI